MMSVIVEGSHDVSRDPSLGRRATAARLYAILDIQANAAARNVSSSFLCRVSRPAAVEADAGRPT